MAELLRSLSDDGFRFEVRGERLHVAPRPDDAIVAQLSAQKPALLSYLAEHGGHWPPPRPRPFASAHRYVLWREARNPARSVCIACGIPPELHGEDALAAALVVDDVDAVVLVAATSAPTEPTRPLEPAPIAHGLARQWGPHSGDAGWTPDGKMCRRCYRIASVRRSDFTCALCVGDGGSKKP